MKRRLSCGRLQTFITRPFPAEFAFLLSSPSFSCLNKRSLSSRRSSSTRYLHRDFPHFSLPPLSFRSSLIPFNIIADLPNYSFSQNTTRASQPSCRRRQPRHRHRHRLRLCPLGQRHLPHRLEQAASLHLRARRKLPNLLRSLVKTLMRASCRRVIWISFLPMVLLPS